MNCIQKQTLDFFLWQEFRGRTSRLQQAFFLRITLYTVSELTIPFIGYYWTTYREYKYSLITFGWLVGCLGFNGPLRQYFSLYRAVSQREGERRERIDESKNVQTTATPTYCKRNRPLPYCNQNCRTPGTGSLPSTIAPPYHPVAYNQ